MSLKKELGKRLLLDMIRAAKGNDPAIVLVVDPHTSKILSSSLRMYDIMEAGVLVLQNINLAREKLPDLPAIYFIDPTPECIEHLIADFPPGCVAGAAAASAKPAQRAQYLNAHLYFTSHVPQVCMNMLKGTPLMKKLKSFVELNVDFLAFESRVFLFDQPATIPRLYLDNDHTKLSSVLSSISKPLVSLCVTMREFPHVRYSAVGRSGICKGLATFFDIDMKKTLSQLSNWEMNQNRERGTLLILDRSVDPVAPLMHEFTFQALVNDLLPVHGEIAEMPISVIGSNGLPKAESELAEDRAASELVLSEDDPLWLEFRHKHIGQVMVEVTRKFKEFKGVNKMAVLQQDDKSSVKDMIQAMKDMPEYKNMMKKYHKHMSIAQECMSRFDARRLTDLGELEQDMATGLNNEGREISMKDVKERLIQLCQDPRVEILDKLRLVMIYMIAQGGLQDSTRRDLMKNVDLDLQNAIRNLEALGVDLGASDKKGKKVSKERLTELKQRNKDMQLALMRYLPVMNGVIEQLVTGGLKEESYPYTSPPPPGSAPTTAASATSARKGVSARKKAASDWKNGDASSSSSSSSSAAGPEEDLRPRFIIFVLGGITFSEMRTAYEQAEKHGVNLYIGSTNTITPMEYIRDLSKLDPFQFEQAVISSRQAAGVGIGANYSGPSYAGGASSSAVPATGRQSSAQARRASQHDSDSDDEPPVNLHKLNVRV